MRPGDDGVSPRKRRRISPPQAAPYVLRQLLDDLPLATEDPNADVHITCVEYWSKVLTRFTMLSYWNSPINCPFKQMTTSISVLPPRRSYTSSAFRRIPLINQANRPLSSRRDCLFSSPRIPPLSRTYRVSSKLSYFQQPIKPVYFAMARSLSTCYRSSARHLAIQKSTTVAGSAVLI